MAASAEDTAYLQLHNALVTAIKQPPNAALLPQNHPFLQTHLACRIAWAAYESFLSSDHVGCYVQHDMADVSAPAHVPSAAEVAAARHHLTTNVIDPSFGPVAARGAYAYTQLNPPAPPQPPLAAQPPLPLTVINDKFLAVLHNAGAAAVLPDHHLLKLAFLLFITLIQETGHHKIRIPTGAFANQPDAKTPPKGILNFESGKFVEKTVIGLIVTDKPHCTGEVVQVRSDFGLVPIRLDYIIAVLHRPLPPNLLYNNYIEQHPPAGHDDQGPSTRKRKRTSAAAEEADAEAEDAAEPKAKRRKTKETRKKDVVMVPDAAEPLGTTQLVDEALLDAVDKYAEQSPSSLALNLKRLPPTNLITKVKITALLPSNQWITPAHMEAAMEALFASEPIPPDFFAPKRKLLKSYDFPDDLIDKIYNYEIKVKDLTRARQLYIFAAEFNSYCRCATHARLPHWYQAVPARQDWEWRVPTPSRKWSWTP